MAFILWIPMGVLIGILANRIASGRGFEGMALAVCIGISGAFIGGFCAILMGIGSVTCINPFNFGLAAFGATFFLMIYRRVKA